MGVGVAFLGGRTWGKLQLRCVDINSIRRAKQTLDAMRLSV